MTRIEPLLDLWGEGEFLAAVAEYLPSCELFVDACVGDGHVYLNYRRAKAFWLNEPDAFAYRVWGAYRFGGELSPAAVQIGQLMPSTKFLVDLATASSNGKPSWGGYHRVISRLASDEPVRLTNFPLPILASRVVMDGQSAVVFLRPPIQPRDAHGRFFCVERGAVASAVKVLSGASNVCWIAVAHGDELDVYRAAAPDAYVYDVSRIEATIWDVRFQAGRRVAPDGDFLVSNAQFIL